MTETRIVIDGMTCTHCEHAIHDSLTPLVGVMGVQVSATNGVAVVEHDGPLDVDAVLAAVSEAGYAVRV